MADKLMRDRIKQIVDFEAPELDVYARFTEAQLLNKDRPEDGLFIAESPKVILRALDAGYVPVSILTEERHIEGEGREVIARCRDIPVYTAGFDVLTRLTGFPLTRECSALCTGNLFRLQQKSAGEQNALPFLKML